MTRSGATATLVPMPIPINKVLDDARALFGQHPALGRMTTVARAELTDQVRAQVAVGRYSFTSDEAEVAGGYGSAPSPVQYALGALAACEAVTYRYWSSLLGVPFDGITVEVRGAGDAMGFLGFDPSASAAIRDIAMTTRVNGPCSESDYKSLHDAVVAHCPVMVTMSQGAAITSELIAEAHRHP